jgi:anti-sigma factor RsiW
MNPESEKPRPDRLADERPPIECLAAFLDGELSAEAWARVQDWLTNHPEDAALVEAHRNLLRRWRETAPPEPSETTWREVLAQIDRGLKIEAGGSRTKDLGRGRWIRVGLLGAAAAAAAILALIVPSRDQDTKTSADPGIEELAIVSADDVDLVSMEDNDAPLLVVGNPPLQEPLELAMAGDVTLVRMEGFARMNPGSSDGPMIIAPKDSNRK